MSQHASERRFAVIRIKPEVAMADAATPLDPGGLDHHQRRPRIGKRAEVADVPVGRCPVVGAVLTHRRNDDAVGKLKARESNGRKQRRCHCDSHSGVWRIAAGEK